jgi:uracil-DNA glycosylase
MSLARFFDRIAPALILALGSTAAVAFVAIAG